jgi:hypothetical protein
MKKEKDKQLLLDRLKETPIVEFACKKAGVGRATYYRWREDKEFAKDADEAIAEGEAFITDMSESQLISMIRDRNFQAIQLWLRHHHAKYNQKIEITANIQHQQEELNPEQEAVVREALRLASLLPEEEPKNVEEKLEENNNQLNDNNHE